MNQVHYELILACINYGAGAIATELTNALNQVVKIANEHTEQVKANNEAKNSTDINKK